MFGPRVRMLILGILLVVAGLCAMFLSGERGVRQLGVVFASIGVLALLLNLLSPLWSAYREKRTPGRI